MQNGVCGVQFDRKDIPMNKFVVCCLEAQFHVFDARTQHPQEVRRKRQREKAVKCQWEFVCSPMRVLSSCFIFVIRYCPINDCCIRGIAKATDQAFICPLLDPLL